MSEDNNAVFMLLPVIFIVVVLLMESIMEDNIRNMEDKERDDE